MPERSPETRYDCLPENPCAVLELIVNNHPGVMSQVCGLLARRAFNVEAILCLPIASDKGEHSRIWLLMDAVRPLDQMIKQVAKLQDVLQIRKLQANRDVFLEVEKLMTLDLSYEMTA